MLKNFHGLEIELNEHTKNNSNFIFCYVRGTEILLIPEEEVRQTILKVVYEHLEIQTDLFISRVEFQNLDIAFYLKSPIPDFQPSQPPFLIIEVKRDFLPVLNFQQQLLDYLTINKCSQGLLMNSQYIYLFSKDLNFKPKQVNLKDISNIFNGTEFHLTADLQDFENAKFGDIDSFKRLTLKYGKTSKVTFLSAESPAPITAFWFEFKQDYILFDICGIKSTSKKHKIKANDFLKLLSIK